MTIKRFEFNMFPVNCYVLSDETREAVVIDAGCFYPEEQETLKNYICENGLQLKHVLNTHLHLDHIFGNAFLVREFGLKPEANQQDEFLIARAADYCRMFGFRINEEPAPLGNYIADGDEIRFGHSRLKALLTPGHSPGSLVFYNEEDGCMFSGDVLFKGSVGRTDLDGGNFEQLRNSVCNRLFTCPDNTIIYPGHGEKTTVGDEKMTNSFFN